VDNHADGVKCKLQADSASDLTALATYPIHRSVNSHPSSSARGADQPHAADETHGAGGREPAAAWGPLPQIGVVRFAGPDAVSFLQGQVSNDTRQLAEGAPLLAAYSSPQGRVIAVMHLLPHSSGILALLPREIAASTRERLRKFVLRAKLKIEDLSDQLVVAGMDASTLGAAGIGVPGSSGYLETNGVGVASVRRYAGSGSERYWLVGDAASVGAAAPIGSTASAPASSLAIEHNWRLADIREGLPQIYAATSELFVAQMLNLDLIGAISFSKGCYTGQEIIARTQNLGRIKRRLYRLRLPFGSWSVGTQLRLGDGRTGRLTEVVPVGKGFEALAVLSLDAAPGDTETPSGESVAAEELPLPYRAA
jgi:tRNA-modifying protein YgfZ